MGFLRFSEVINLKWSDIILRKTHMYIFTDKRKFDAWKHGLSTHRSLCSLETYRTSLNAWYHLEKNMDFSKKHLLLLGNFHAIFDKIETDMIQIIRTWNWI